LICRYQPPILWGKNGHFQTIIAALCGRKSCPILTGTLYFTQLTDGTVVSYEVFEPAKNAVFVENQVLGTPNIILPLMMW